MSPVFHRMAELYAHELEELSKAGDGTVSPEAVVANAKDLEESWNDNNSRMSESGAAAEGAVIPAELFFALYDAAVRAYMLTDLEPLDDDHMKRYLTLKTVRDLIGTTRGEQWKLDGGEGPQGRRRKVLSTSIGDLNIVLRWKGLQNGNTYSLYAAGKAPYVGGRTFEVEHLLYGDLPRHLFHQALRIQKKG